MSLEKKLAAVIEKYRQHPQFLGDEITDVNQRGAMDDSLLHLAAESGATEDIDVLVASGADVNAIGDIGNTPLHSASLMGKIDVAKRLLDLGADPTLKNELNRNAGDVASARGHGDVAEL